MRLGVVLLSAGKSSRFGRNKLLEDVGGRPMICRTMEAAAALDAARRAAVVSCDEVAALAGKHGFDIISNDVPENGQAHSVVLGVRAMQDLDAVLFLAGDQPLITRESLCLLVRRFIESGKGIACLADETHRGNPAIFAAEYYPELLALGGDRGAKGILRANENDLLVVRCLHADELADADTPKALETIRSRMI